MTDNQAPFLWLDIQPIETSAAEQALQLKRIANTLERIAKALESIGGDTLRDDFRKRF